MPKSHRKATENQNYQENNDLCMCLKPLIQLSAKVKSCRPQSFRGAVRGNAKRHIDVIFLSHPPTKITSSVVMNEYLVMKNVDI